MLLVVKRGAWFFIIGILNPKIDPSLAEILFLSAHFVRFGFKIYINPWPHYLLHLVGSKIANLVQRVFSHRHYSGTTETYTHKLFVSPSVTQTIQTQHVFVVTITGLSLYFQIKGNKRSKLKKRQMARTSGRFHLSTHTIGCKYPGRHSNWEPWQGLESA